MKLRLEQVTASPTSLVLGVVIEGPKEAWIRFAVLSVPYERVPYAAIERMMRQRFHDLGDDVEEADEPLF